MRGCVFFFILLAMPRWEELRLFFFPLLAASLADGKGGSLRVSVAGFWDSTSNISQLQPFQQKIQPNTSTPKFYGAANFMKL